MNFQRIKRRRVSAALHAELTEYSSLLRALRSSSTLDVVPDCLEFLGTESEPIHDLPQSVSPCPSPYSDVSSYPLSHTNSIGPRNKRQCKPIYPNFNRRRDRWTRWPLLLKDVHIPEWSLEDEVGHIAERILNSRIRQAAFKVCSEDEEHLDTANSTLSFLPHLSNAASNYLSSIFALLAANIPNRAESLQNRIEPMGWRGVLSVLCSSPDPAVADPNVINAVKARLEATYDNTSDDELDSMDILAHRMEIREEAKKKFQAQLQEQMQSLFEITPELSTPIDKAACAPAHCGG